MSAPAGDHDPGPATGGEPVAVLPAWPVLPAGPRRTPRCLPRARIRADPYSLRGSPIRAVRGSTPLFQKRRLAARTMMTMTPSMVAAIIATKPLAIQVAAAVLSRVNDLLVF